MAGDSAPKTLRLEALARKQFGKLGEAEVRVLRAASEGGWAFCGPTSDENDPSNNPANADRWDKQREVRAEMICWLCLDPGAVGIVKPHGIQIHAARVRDLLCLAFATLPFPIGFRQCRLDDIDLHYASVPALLLSGSSIGSCSADGLDVKGSVLLNGFSATGDFRLPEARIGGILACEGAKFSALHADGVDVKGDVLLRHGFYARDELHLNGSQIGGNLSCEDGAFGRVDFEGLVTKGGFFWKQVRGCTLLALAGASVAVLSDDEGSWQKTGELLIDGFVYERILNSPVDAEMRLKWLGGQTKFAPQPYRQLAKVLREMGYDDASKQVLFELEARIRAEERKSLLEQRPIIGVLDSIGDAFSWATIGYGIHPGWAILESIGLTGLGWIIFRRAYRKGAMVPTDKDALTAFRKGQTPPHYQPFTPLIYSVENCLPLVKFGQDERWQPDADFKQPTPEIRRKSGWFFQRVLAEIVQTLVRAFALTPAKLRWFRWIMIALGWLLATFFVASLTGLIKN